VNGLAAVIGIITASSFGIWFTLMNSDQYAILAFSLVGSLLGFLWFNRTPAKIFMGDTGSLILGLVASLLAIKFIEMNRGMDRHADFKILSVPVVTIGILIVPLYDTLRVFFIRIMSGKSPMHPDRNHIHHILLDSGLSHMQTTTVLGAFNILMIGVVFLLQGFVSGEIILLLVLGIAMIFSLILSRMKVFFAKTLI
jgi:UDP-GlcNAc:undecaprenyl-phosphate/decaprenyl-phosphate GlcNAc-1-phosphate transferase